MQPKAIASYSIQTHCVNLVGFSQYIWIHIRVSNITLNCYKRIFYSKRQTSINYYIYHHMHLMFFKNVRAWKGSMQHPKKTYLTTILSDLRAPIPYSVNMNIRQQVYGSISIQSAYVPNRCNAHAWVGNSTICTIYTYHQGCKIEGRKIYSLWVRRRYCSLESILNIYHISIT